MLLLLSLFNGIMAQFIKLWRKTINKLVDPGVTPSNRDMSSLKTDFICLVEKSKIWSYLQTIYSSNAHLCQLKQHLRRTT